MAYTKASYYVIVEWSHAALIRARAAHAQYSYEICPVGPGSLPTVSIILDICVGGGGSGDDDESVENSCFINDALEHLICCLRCGVYTSAVK